jgi:hypothetical protein
MARGYLKQRPRVSTVVLPLVQHLVTESTALFLDVILTDAWLDGGAWSLPGEHIDLGHDAGCERMQSVPADLLGPIVDACWGLGFRWSVLFAEHGDSVEPVVGSLDALYLGHSVSAITDCDGDALIIVGSGSMSQALQLVVEGAARLGIELREDNDVS